MIELKKINKIYKSGNNEVQAIKECNLKFNNKGLISVVGASGCGKTTLLNLIGGLDNEYDGEILFNNTSTKQYKSKDWDKYRSNHIGFIFQEYNLINTISVYDNIELAINGYSKKEKHNKIIEISKKLKIETLLKRNPLELSGGQKQRVAIARAIIKEPTVILADEPTGALDSKTSIEIMDILKDLSKNYLVIMVTHNENIANHYSDRIIKMLDGLITDDKYINNCYNDEHQYKLKEQTHNTFASKLFKMSFNNLQKKLVRTLLMIFACSIGIVALCLVITVSSGMSLYIEDVQEQALRTYPVTINSIVDDEEPEYEDIKYEEYPDDDIINIIDDKLNYNGHVNTFTNDFMNHIRKMDINLYSAINYSGWVKMRLVSKNENSYHMISSYTFLEELSYDNQYVNYEYDVLEGELPTTKNELVLVIDRNNCINRDILSSLGIETNELKSLKFSDIIGKKYKIITPDLYYVKKDNKYVTYRNGNKSTEDIYNESQIELEIKCIIRQKPSAKTKLYTPSILYSPLLTDFLLEYNNNCDILKDQRKDPSVDVLTGKPFEDIQSGSSLLTKEYQYERNIIDFGGNFTVSRVLIYTDKFENFELIHDYIELYNNKDVSISKIKYNDYLKNMSDEFTTFMDVLTNVLLVFALISLTVAGIMIIIITYVSVIEKTKQVGILRSLGMSKFNVMCLFIYENVILGLCSGVIGVTLGTVLIKPVLSIIVNVIKDINLNNFDVNNLNMNGFNIGYLLLLILVSIMLTVISGIIPSIMASKKDPVKALMHQ